MLAQQQPGEELSNLEMLQNTSRRWWTPSQRLYLHDLKTALIGRANQRGSYKCMNQSRMFESDQGDPVAPCRWDCFRRCTMLEPLVAQVLMDNVPGDFLEAGVLLGGISIYMAAMLNTSGQLQHRRVWVADSFVGLPPPDYSDGLASATGLEGTILGNMVGRYTHGRLQGTLSHVKANFNSFLPGSEDSVR